MCYDKEYHARKTYKYAERYSNDAKEIEHYREQLSTFQPAYCVSGFSHPLAPVITNEKPHDIQALRWGLIPFWCKDLPTATQLSNQTLNARGETIFDKPAFRAPAAKRRCLITCVDGFFEHHHQGKKKYPFFIKLKNDEPMTLAGLWDKWIDKQTGEEHFTYTVVTTVANPLMEKIHNNPNAEGPRMPVILPKELEREWLREINDPLDKELVSSLIKPYPVEEMDAYPVGQLKGKSGIGNKPEATTRQEYQDLQV
jgi:putative SOS response-associated peptidase YedK